MSVQDETKLVSMRWMWLLTADNKYRPVSGDTVEDVTDWMNNKKKKVLKTNGVDTKNIQSNTIQYSNVSIPSNSKQALKQFYDESNNEIKKTTKNTHQDPSSTNGSTTKRRQRKWSKPMTINNQSGFNCYAASLMQVIMATPAFQQQTFLSQHYQVHQDNKHCTACLLHLLQQNPDEAAMIVPRIATLSMGSGQQDANELFHLLINKLDSIFKVKVGVNESLMQTFYCGEHEAYMCSHCWESYSQVLAIHSCISLMKSSSSSFLEDSIDDHYHPYQMQFSLTNANVKSCMSCHSTDKMFNKFTRFVPDQTLIFRIQSGDNVGVRDTTIDMSKYSVSERTQENMFELYAFIHYKGNGEYGHYTSFVLIDGNWYECNDSTTTKVDIADKLRTKGGNMFFYSSRQSSMETKQ
jgi:ubiquitin C-terminal hydrolase